MPQSEPPLGAAWRDGLEQWRRERMDRPWNGSKCSWCRTDREMARQEHEGPHVTWCPRYRPEERRRQNYCTVTGTASPVATTASELSR